MPASRDDRYFLRGGNKTGELLRNHPWKDHPLGDPVDWPVSLKTTVSILLQSPVPILLVWGEDESCFFNDPFAQLISYQSMQVALPAAMLFRGAGVNSLADQALIRLDSSALNRLLSQLLHPDAATKPTVSFSYSNCYDDYGTITGILATGTHLILADEAISKREARLRSIIQAAPVAIGLFTGRDLIIEEPNQTFIDIVGKGDWIIGKPLVAAMPELITEGQPFLKVLDDVFTTGVMFQTSGTMVKIVQNGVLTNNYYDFTYTPLFDEQGKVYAILDIAIDVTQQVLNKMALEEANDRLTLALKAGDLGLFEIDPATDSVLPSDRFLEMFELEKTFDREQFIERVHPDDQEGRRLAYVTARQTGILDYTARLIFPDLRTKWIRVQGIYTINANDQQPRILGIAQDITGAKELEFQKDAFLGIASHELKTPVTTIKAYVQLMEQELRQTGNERMAEMMSRVDRQVNRLNFLIGDLLDVTKIQSGKLRLNYTRFHLASMVEDVVVDLGHTLPSHRILINNSCKGEIFADRERLGQVLTNLLSNAVKYSPGKDSVDLEIRETGGQIEFSIRDQGIGIPADKQDRLFEQFYRVNGNKRNAFPGLGLGLFISAEIVKRMNGRIWVQSEVNTGSAFSFSIPATE